MREVERREVLRTGLFAAASLAVPGLLAACGTKRAAPARAKSLQALAEARLAAGAAPGLDVFLAGEDFVTGIENYLAFGLVRRGAGPVEGGAATMWLAPTADPRAEVSPVGPFTAPWQGYSKPDARPPAPQGINAAGVRFDRAGVWTTLVEVRAPGVRLLGNTALQVKPAGGGSTRVPGQKPIPSQTPTVDDHRGVDPICTREPPCDMHRVTLAKALTLGKPVAFIVATPKYCMSRTCGPNLEELITVQQEVGDRAAFVHAEVYKDDKPDTIAKQIVSPAFAEWKFQSEPWLFLIDRAGTIASRFEGPVTAAVIRSPLSRLLG